MSSEIHNEIQRRSQESDIIKFQIEDLSKREREILELIAKGNTEKEMASELNLSENTINVHTQRIYRKLNVHVKTDAALKLYKYKQQFEQ